MKTLKDNLAEILDRIDFIYETNYPDPRCTNQEHIDTVMLLSDRVPNVSSSHKHRYVYRIDGIAIMFFFREDESTFCEDNYQYINHLSKGYTDQLRLRFGIK